MNSHQKFLKLNANYLEELYEPCDTIGRGSYAQVIKAKQLKTKKIRAVKRIQINPLSEDLSEVSRLKILKADHIIEFYGYIHVEDSNQLNIIMHLCQGSLRDLLNNKVEFNQPRLLNLIVQVTSAMIALNEKFIMHLDLKPENILYENQDYFKLCDFGCSQLFYSISKVSKAKQHKQISNLQFRIEDCMFGTPQYISPEIQLGIKTVNKSSCDIWSFGIILYEIIYRTHPFQIDQGGRVKPNELQRFYKNELKIDYHPTQFRSIIDLLKMMLIADPLKRISWKKVKQYLITHFKKEECEFLNIEQVAESQRKMLLIFTSLIMLIEGSIQKCEQSQLSNSFWIGNKNLLLAFKSLLLLLGYLQMEKFFAIFSYKLSYKIKEQKLVELNFLFENCREQALAHFQDYNERKKFDDKQVEIQLKKLMEQLEEAIRLEKQQPDQVKIFLTFFSECKQSKTLFCNGHLFDKTASLLQIVDDS